MTDAVVLTSARLAAVVGVSERTIHTILTTSKCTKGPNGSGWDFNAALKAIVAWYKERSESIDNEAAKDRARKSKAEANISEMEEAQMKGELVSIAEGKKLFDSAIVKFRESIRRLDSLTDKQKSEVCELLAAAKISDG